MIDDCRYINNVDFIHIEWSSCMLKLWQRYAFTLPNQFKNIDHIHGTKKILKRVLKEIQS